MNVSLLNDMICGDEVQSLIHSLSQKAIFKHLAPPLWKRKELVTFNLEREIIAKLPSSVLVRFVQQWCAWGINSRTVQVDNSAPLVRFGNGYDHQFWSSVEPISAASTVYFQSYYLRIQLMRVHKIAPILADKLNAKWKAVVGKNYSSLYLSSAISWFCCTFPFLC